MDAPLFGWMLPASDAEASSQPSPSSSRFGSPESGGLEPKSENRRDLTWGRASLRAPYHRLAGYDHGPQTVACGSSVDVRDVVHVEGDEKPSVGTVCGKCDKPSRCIDLTGQRFGRLVVARRAPSAASHARWLCSCDCGAESVVESRQLRSGHTRSCGCLQRDTASELSRTHGHTVARSAEYSTWLALRDRCSNPRNRSFRNYGGRGISVCARWDSFENFLSDMGQKPSRLHSIDRVDVNGNYEPTNCRWATAAEQNQNTRAAKLDALSAVLIRQLRLRRVAIKDIAHAFGIDPSVASRVAAGKAWADVLRHLEEGVAQ